MVEDERVFLEVSRVPCQPATGFHSNDSELSSDSVRMVNPAGLTGRTRTSGGHLLSL